MGCKKLSNSKKNMHAWSVKFSSVIKMTVLCEYKVFVLT